MPAPFTIEDLEATPEFRKMDLEKQNETRDRYFQTYLATDPGFAGLDQQGRMDAYRLIVDRDPVFDSDAAPAVLQVRGDVAALSGADPLEAEAARGRLKARYAALGATRDSLVANVLALGEDVVSELWDPGENHYKYEYGREGKKLDAYVLRSLAQTARDPGEVEALQGLTTGLSIVASIAESLIPLGAIGQLGKAGRLTAGAFEKVASVAARMPSGVFQRFVASAGEQTVQALGMAAYGAVQSLVVDGAQEGWSIEALPKVAKAFGQNLATDYAMWLGMSALGVAGRFVKALKTSEGAKAAAKAVLDMPSEKLEREFAQEILKTGQVPAWARTTLDADYVKGLEEEFARTRAAAAASGLRTKEDVGKIVAMSVGVETRTNEKGLVEAFEAGTGQALGTWKNYDDLVFDVTHNVAPKKGNLRAPTTFTTLRAKDTVAVEDVDADRRYELYARELEAGGPDEIAHAIEGLTGMRVEKVNDLYGTRALFGKSVPADKEAGRITIDNAELRNRITLGGENGVLPVPADGFKTVSDGIAYINALRDLGFIEKKSKSATRVLDAVLGRGKGMTSPVGRANAAATWGIARKMYPLAQIYTLEGGSVRLVQRLAKDSDEVKNLYEAKSIEDLRAWLIDQALSRQALPLADLQGGVAQLTGARLTKESVIVRDGEGKPTSLVYWALRATADKDHPDGRLLAKADTLMGLMEQRPDVKNALKYPASYAPKVYIADPAAKTLTFDGAVAYGQTQDLLMLGDKFGTPFTGPSSKPIVAKAVPGERPVFLDKATRRYSWVPYDGAVPRRAGTLAAVQNMIAKEKNTLDGFRREANARQAELIVLRDGRVGVIESGGEMRAFKTRREIETYFKERPVLEETKAPDLLPEVQWSPDIKSGLEAEYAKRVKDIHVTTPDALKEKTFKSFMHKLTNPMTPVSIIGRTESVLSEYTKRTGHTILSDAYRDTEGARRLLNTLNRPYVPFIDRIIRGNSVVERERMGTLLWVDKANRAKAAQELYGATLTKEDLEKIADAEGMLDVVFKSSGLGDFSSLASQRTEILARVEELKKTGKLEVCQSARDVLAGLYGAQTPRALELFTEGVSKNDFLAYLADNDIGAFMLSTIDRVNKMKVYKPLQQRLCDAWVHAKKAVESGELPKSALEYFGETLNDSFGLKTAAGERLAESTKAFSGHLVSLLSKSATLRNIGIPQEVNTDDIIGKLGEIFTLNSQAWRIWAIPRNLTQVSLLGAVIGNGTAWRAFQHVLDHKDYIEKAYARGALQESIMAVGNESVTPLRAVMKLGLHPMEIADAVTRGACLKAAEDLVGQAAARQKTRVLDAAHLIRELQADLCTPEQQALLVKLVGEGQLSAASDQLGQFFQAMTQFDYARGASGSATRFTIGRLFGKLGVYPMHTIDLYRRILTQGDAASRVERVARLVGTSTAMYLAAEAVGISYSGFLATDPFSFSGGPYWTVLNDALNSIGDQPENATARARLSRNLPRMVIPTAMWWPYAEKAVAAAQDRDLPRLLMAMATAPAVKEDNLWKDFRSGVSDFGGFGVAP